MDFQPAKRKAGSDTWGINSVAASAWKSGYPSTRDTYKKERQVIGKLRRNKVRWKPSSSAEIVSYRIYWSTLGSVDYDSP